jgi:oligoendopeptidase F
MKQSRTRSARRDFPDRWDLSDLLKDPTASEELFRSLEHQVSQFEALREQLQPGLSTQSFLDALRMSEDIAVSSSKVGGYAYLWFSQNTKDQAARAFRSKVEERLTALNNRMLFFDLWWQKLDEANAARLLEHSGDYRYHLETIRRFKPHTLTEAEEKVINIKNVTGRGAIDTLYDVLTNGFTFRLRINGTTRSLTREELSGYVRHPSARVREHAYHALYRVFEANHDVIGEMYSALVQDWKNENLGLRTYPTPIAVRNLGNDVPNEAVDALLTACRKNVEVFQRYFRIKARICRLKRLTRYHLYAPHRAGRARYPYEVAVRMVLDSYHGFSERLGDLARRVFEDRHLDARTYPGKMSGAYCYSVAPGLTPYVLLNYTGEARDVSTLAHELGHALHGMLAADHSIFTFHATLPLAETASVFGERILSDRLLLQEKDKAVKQSLLISQLDDIYATVVRQAYFVRFEQAAHQQLAAGATVNDLAETYLKDLRQQFGRAVVVPEEFKWEWLTIPHIFGSPFYCYAYSFGNLLVLALYRKYKEEGATFVPQYLDLLAAGGSESPEALLRPLHVDIRSEAFWQSGFDTIREMVEELERMA